MLGGSRVDDAFASAGGLGNNADSDAFAKKFKLATKLTDGAKLYITSIISSNTSSDSVDTSHNPLQNEILNVNRASESELDALPGTGLGLAIFSWI